MFDSFPDRIEIGSGFNLKEGRTSPKIEEKKFPRRLNALLELGSI
jgi:hypothetical protein